MAITMRIVCAYETSRVVFPTDPRDDLAMHTIGRQLFVAD